MEITSSWDKPFQLEQKVAHIISQQAKHGCDFNSRNAHWYVHLLTERILNIDLQLVPTLPPMMHKGTEYKAPFKLNGQPKVFVKKYMDAHGLKDEEVGGPFSAVWFTPFDPGKTDRLKSVMLDMGWMPTEWNQKKMPFQLWTYKKRLEKTTYRKFIEEQCSTDERELFLPLVNGFIAQHFSGKSKGYMKAILSALGFDLKRVPNFDQIKKRLLLSQFWPTSPKITEDSFESIGEEEGHSLKLLKERMVWSHRRSLIQGLISLTRQDGKISGEANPCATPTARMRHKGIVNIPAAGAPFGEECRSLFRANKRKGAKAKLVHKLTAQMVESGKFRRKPFTNIMQVANGKGGWEDEGHVSFLIPAGQDAFVGGDGAGLELRMLTHYLIAVSKMLLQEAEEAGNEKLIKYYGAALQSAYEYREVLLNGDIHSHNQKLAGLPTRKSAKTFIYAFLYGAGDANLGGQLGAGREEGAALRSRFLKECPCIPVLIEWVQGFAKQHGWVPAIDGRKLIMRRDPFSGEVMAHKALNTMLQAAGSIVMKYAGCYLTSWNARDCLDCHQVIMMHDEYQFTCKWEDVEALRRNIDSCVKKAGEYLKMECPLASDSMLGANWLHTH